MKKLMLFLILFIFLIGCKESPENKQSPEKEVPETPKTLTEFQVIACNSADEAGTCDTRLAELGIVLTEDCCQILGKCC